ncbi:MAG: DUF3575 domain-containing protein [Alistipes indistinctus]|nr:DUF3575 domain-containing protein [Alistipes indistinctus]
MICVKKSISGRGCRSRAIRMVFLLGFLSYGFTVTAQETRSDVSAGNNENFRQTTNTLTDGQDTVVFRFAPKRRMFWADYKGNAAALDSLTRSIRQHKLSIESGNMKVRVLGFCSSYNSPQENLATAKNRSNQVKSYFIIREGLKEEHFRTTNSTRRWRGMTDVIAVAYLFQNTKAIAHSDVQSNRCVVPADSLSENEAPAYRRTPEPAVEPDAPVAERPAEPESEPAQPVVEALAGALGDPVRPRQRWAVKTNIAYLAATVANLGVEHSFGDHYSVDLPVIYSPYTVARDYRLRFLAILPEFRYWLGTPMKGHFFGAHLHIGAFNISVDKHTRYQSPDGFYGVGLSYGYMLPFARHWAAEFTVGAGYVHTKYDAYYNIPNGARYEKGIPYNYWGLTKVGINLVYRFGK